MHILITSFTFPPEANGVSDVAYAHASGLASRGHKVVVATGYSPERKKMRPLDNLEIVEFKVSGNANPRSFYRGDIKGYRDYITRFRGDLIICHCWQIWSTDLLVPVLCRTKARSILVSHGVSANMRYHGAKSLINWLCWRPYILQMPHMLKSFSMVVHLSPRQDKDKFYDRYLGYKLGLTNYSIVPNGTNLERFRNIPVNFRKLYAIGDGPLILHVGNYDPRKNQEMALRAFAGAECKDATLVFIGSDFNYYSKHLELVYQSLRANGQMGKVIILEKVGKDDIYGAYKAADICVCSSTWEAQPLVILDAMGSSTPFISTNVGCVTDLPGGYVVQSEQEMVTQMKLLVNDLSLREKLGHVGLEACEKLYNWPKVVDSYEELVEQVCRR